MCLSSTSTRQTCGRCGKRVLLITWVPTPYINSATTTSATSPHTATSVTANSFNRLSRCRPQPGACVLYKDTRCRRPCRQHIPLAEISLIARIYTWSCSLLYARHHHVVRPSLICLDPDHALRRIINEHTITTMVMSMNSARLTYKRLLASEPPG